jgi:hypothetical protein
MGPEIPLTAVAAPPDSSNERSAAEACASAIDAIAAGLRAPSGGRVLTDSPVDRLA